MLHGIPAMLLCCRLLCPIATESLGWCMASYLSAAFAEPGALCAVPRSQRRCVHVLREVAVEAMGGRRVALRPHCEPGDTFRGALRISVQVDYGHRMRAQHFEMERREFASAASAARTFCFAEDVAKMRWSGLAKGGSLDNAVVFSRGTFLQNRLYATS